MTAGVVLEMDGKKRFALLVLFFLPLDKKNLVSFLANFRVWTFFFQIFELFWIHGPQ